MDNLKELVTEIKEGLSQTSSSQKDEIKVMKAMLNDRDFKVDIYGKDGVESQYCPAEDARAMFANVLSSTTKINDEEATTLMDKYEFKKSDAVSMINLSKEFVNTFMQTGRKLPLGGRAESNISLAPKRIEETTRTYPKKIGIDNDGSGCYENVPTTIKAHDSIRVYAPCPTWVK